MRARAFLVGLIVLALGVSANAQIRSPQDHLGFRVGDDYKLLFNSLYFGSAELTRFESTSNN